MATRILAVLNQKGGVGKTTTCVNLGAALARRGFRVLLVDMDPQANLTVHLGLEPPRLQRTTYSLLIGQHGLAEAVHETGVPGLFVVPSTLALANAEIQLAATVGRELVLREALEAWLDPTTNGDALPFEPTEDTRRPAADFVLIDCPPSLGTLTMNALCAAGEVLLPIQTEFFALQGVAGILESVRAVQRLNKALRLSMVVPSLVDRRTTLARDVIDEVRSYFGDLVTRTEIRKNIKLAEAPSHGKTIFEWDPRCNGALDYDALAGEVLGETLPPDDAPAAVETPVPEAVTPAPEAVSPAPEAVSPAPEPVSPVPEAVSPVPEAAAPEAVSPVPEAVSPVPEAVSPVPEAVSPVPEAVSPVPETPAPEPHSSSHAASTGSAAADIATGTVSDDDVRAADEAPSGHRADAAAVHAPPARASGIGLAAALADALPAPAAPARAPEPAAPAALLPETSTTSIGSAERTGTAPPSRLPPAAADDVVAEEAPAADDDDADARAARTGDGRSTSPPRVDPRDDEPAGPTADRASWWRSLRRNTLGS